jgi:hypothetical protein
MAHDSRVGAKHVGRPYVAFNATRTRDTRVFMRSAPLLRVSFTLVRSIRANDGNEGCFRHQFIRYCLSAVDASNVKELRPSAPVFLMGITRLNIRKGGSLVDGINGKGEMRVLSAASLIGGSYNI